MSHQIQVANTNYMVGHTKARWGPNNIGMLLTGPVDSMLCQGLKALPGAMAHYDVENTGPLHLPNCIDSHLGKCLSL